MTFSEKFLSFKQQGRKITMLTAYDYPTAVILDEAGIDILLVGDSLANVVLGLEATTQVGMQEMLHHALAVVRGSQKACVVVDMPFSAYQPQQADVVLNAKKFIDIGCQAVKVEWFDRCVEIVKQLKKHHIDVIGHIGLTPQTAENFNVKGRGEQAEVVFQQALSLQEAGCSMIVVECVPKDLAQKITQTLNIPTIGIGAGIHCDGQVLVTQDLLGMHVKKIPKFVKQYADLKTMMTNAVQQYKTDVKTESFPDEDHCFH